jgi:hypothetical protein
MSKEISETNNPVNITSNLYSACNCLAVAAIGTVSCALNIFVSVVAVIDDKGELAIEYKQKAFMAAAEVFDNVKKATNHLANVGAEIVRKIPPIVNNKINVIKKNRDNANLQDMCEVIKNNLIIPSKTTINRSSARVIAYQSISSYHSM